MLRTHRSLQAYCATLWWRCLVYSFFRVMEHRWNEIDRGKPKHSGKNLSQCYLSTTNPTWTDPRSNPGSGVRGRQLTAWAMARPQWVIYLLLGKICNARFSVRVPFCVQATLEGEKNGYSKEFSLFLWTGNARCGEHKNRSVKVSCTLPP
jgi:hypothetical protein